jgi:hypothetical protein
MKTPRTPAPEADPSSSTAEPWTKKTVELPPSLWWRLKARAVAEQRPVRETLVTAITDYLDRKADFTMGPGYSRALRLKQERAAKVRR